MLLCGAREEVAGQGKERKARARDFNKKKKWHEEPSTSQQELSNKKY